MLEFIKSLIGLRNTSQAGDGFEYLEPKQVKEFHDKLIEYTGGRRGFIDEGLVDSAVTQPQWDYYKSIEEKAGVLLYSLAKNHGFQDGNKRTALICMLVFLSVNGYDFACEPLEAAKKLVYFVENDSSREEYIEWIKQHARQSTRNEGRFQFFVSARHGDDMEE